MTEPARKSRDLDHLMEQNSTELDFLSAYGGSSSSGEGSEILAALRRFLKAGGVTFKSSAQETAISFDFGKATVEKSGCKVVFKGKNLPLVPSDILQHGFIHGKLTKQRTSCTVTMVEWGIEQRRYIERMVEYLNHDE